jgi:hypothetical protein
VGGICGTGSILNGGNACGTGDGTANGTLVTLLVCPSSAGGVERPQPLTIKANANAYFLIERLLPVGKNIHIFVKIILDVTGHPFFGGRVRLYN